MEEAKELSLEQLKSRFDPQTKEATVYRACLLDPRFKQACFPQSQVSEMVEDLVAEYADSAEKEVEEDLDEPEHE